MGNLTDLQAFGEALFRAADEALYQAKEQGRDRVYSSAQPLTPEPIDGDDRQHPSGEDATEIAIETTA